MLYVPEPRVIFNLFLLGILAAYGSAELIRGSYLLEGSLRWCESGNTLITKISSFEVSLSLSDWPTCLNLINPVLANILFIYFMKISENQCFLKFLAGAGRKNGLKWVLFHERSLSEEQLELSETTISPWDIVFLVIIKLNL